MKNFVVYVLFAILSIGTYVVLDHYGAVKIAHNLINQVEYKIETIINR